MLPGGELRFLKIRKSLVGLTWAHSL
jgi:hypothetical protein